MALARSVIDTRPRMSNRPREAPPADADALAPTLALPAPAEAPGDGTFDRSRTTPSVRYAPSAPLGRGGMGEVMACRDRVIEREVAKKALLPELEGDPQARARFVREARVQGQLEHPAIVPVYDLGERADGVPYFVMKRVRGLILSLEPLVPRGSLREMLDATLAGVDASLASRAPARDVAPELAAICLRATALEPAARHPSARALCEEVERYLEGDRDLERRRGASAQHSARAEHALEAALTGTVPFEEGRARAMKELNRALALDPDNRGAMRTMVRLLTETPREVPEEVRARARAEDQRTLQMGARLSSLTPLLYLLMLPIVYALGVRNGWLVGGVVLAIAGAALAGHVVSSRASLTTRRRGEWAIVGLRALVLLSLTRMFGPLVLVPTLAAAFGVAMQVHPEKVGRHVGAWVACLIVGVPTLLEWGGVLPASYLFSAGEMSIVPQMHELPAAPTGLLLLVASIVTIATACVFVGRIRRALSAAQLRLQLTAWHLERLIPDDAANPS